MNDNYFETFIAVAEDCKVEQAKVPEPRGGKPTVAMMQYEMLSKPFEHTQEEVLFEVWLARQDNLDATALAEDELVAMREQFFAKGQPCLRASPLTKTHGWGVIFDADGKAALVAMESPDYNKHLNNPNLEVLKAMRSKRAS